MVKIRKSVEAAIHKRRSLVTANPSLNRRKVLPEFCLPILIHLLAHHPDFAITPDALRLFQRFSARYGPVSLVFN